MRTSNISKNSFKKHLEKQSSMVDFQHTRLHGGTRREQIGCNC